MSNQLKIRCVLARSWLHHFLPAFAAYKLLPPNSSPRGELGFGVRIARQNQKARSPFLLSLPVGSCPSCRAGGILRAELPASWRSQGTEKPRDVPRDAALPSEGHSHSPPCRQPAAPAAPRSRLLIHRDGSGCVTSSSS